MSAHKAVKFSCGSLSWNFALTQPQRPGLAAGTEGTVVKKWEGLRWLERLCSHVWGQTGIA